MIRGLLAFAVLLAGCAAFVGPATKIDDSYLITCGTEKCDPSFWQCSSPWYPPSHCVSKLAGVSRDAGGGQ